LDFDFPFSNSVLRRDSSKLFGLVARSCI
jgi:hypothetical protein